MSDEATQLKLAQDLVKDGEYEQARAILSTLPDNPTAQKWLAQLDERYPNQKSAQEENALRQAQELIDQEQYAEASALLRTISHNETAQKWLSRIENLEKSSSGDSAVSFEPPVTNRDAFPVPAQANDVLKTNVLDKLGHLNGTIALGAVTFGVLSALVQAINSTEGFVVALLGALLFGGFAYVVSMALAITDATITKNTLFAFIGFSAIGVFVGFLILDSSSSILIRWLVYIILGGGIAYVLSRMNTYTNTATSTAISKSLMPLSAIALTLIFHARPSIINTFIIESRFGGLGLGNFVGGLVGGLIVGALLTAIIVISLRESK